MGRYVETRAVLAGAYSTLDGHALLTHVAEVRGGAPVRVACGQVKPESLADTHATNPFAAPTCLRCRALLKKWLRAAPSETP